MTSKIINLSLPSDLVKIIDERAKREYSTRSDYIKRAIIEKLRASDALDPLVPQKTYEEMQKERLKEFLDDFAKNTPIEDMEDLE